METIASKLKTRRESLNISLEQISQNTRISIHNLRSLENGRYADLPGGMYNRAILRTYCDEIGLDKDELLQCYDDETAPRQEKPIISSPRRPSPGIKANTVVFGILIFISGIGLFLSGEWLISVLSPYVLSGYGNPISGLQAAADAQTENVPAETTFTVSRSDSNNDSLDSLNAPPKPTAQSAFKANTNNLQPLRLEIFGKEECWLSIDSDESGAVTKILSPGEVEFFTATRTISLIVGNAGGVSLRINDRAAKTLGQSGQVVRLTIDENTLHNLIDPSSS